MDTIINWKDINPRIGASYDLFGNGRTAVKGSVGKYFQQEATGFAAKYNPLQEGSDTVTWSDLNGDDIAQDNELGAANNATLGVRRNINPDPDMKRPYQVLYNLGVQHQIMSRLSVSVNYFRREYKNMSYTKSLAVPLTAYDLVNIADPRGNGQTLPIYNLQRAYLGLVNDLDTTSSENWRHYNGVDFTMNARGGNGMSVAGGVSLGRSISKTCEVGDPNQLRFCDQTLYNIPLAKTVKLTWAYPLPWDIRFSGVFQTADGFNTSAPPAPTADKAAKKGETFQFSGELLDVDVGVVSVRATQRCGDCNLRRGMQMLGEMVQEMLRQAATRPRGTIKLTTEPPGARVEIDGRDLGETPYLRDAFVGPHDVLVTKEGFAAHRMTATVEDGQTVELTAPLLPEKPQASRRLPGIRIAKWVLLGVGTVAVVGGITLLGLTGSQNCTGTAPNQVCGSVFDGRPAGIPLVSVGALSLDTSAFLFIYDWKQSSAAAAAPATVGAQVHF